MTSALKPGEVIERYVVERELGRGGMAVVYRVRHRQLHTLHALKVLTLPGENVQARLITEGRVQATVRHAHLVAVNDVLDIGGQPGLLMEYVDGPSLDRLIARGLAIEEAERIFRGVLAGVGHAHAHGLVHRDLKPGNVLLAPTGGQWLPKVTDFGLAKVLWDGDERGQTRTNVALGTPDYMAPEQIRDARTVDARADIFSLGCMLYEMVTGRPPFMGQDLLTVLSAVAAGDFLPPEQHVPTLPEPIRAAIMGMMEVDREKRLPDCASVLDVLEGRPPEARPGDTWARQSWPVAVRPEWEDLNRRKSEANAPPVASEPAPSIPPPPESQPGIRFALAGAGVLAVIITAVGVAGLALQMSGTPDPPAPAAAPAVVAAPEATPMPEADEVSPVDDAAATPEPTPTPTAKKATTTSRGAGTRGAVAIGGGSVKVTGDARAVELVSKTARWPPGDVPADTYTVMARFAGDRAPVAAGTITVRSGDALTLNCSAAFARCAEKR